MSNTTDHKNLQPPPDRKKKLQPLLSRLKSLQQESAKATEQLASDQGTMLAYEADRDRNYARCRELGVEPDDLRAEIDRRLSSMDMDISRLEARFKTLSEVEAEHDGD